MKIRFLGTGTSNGNPEIGCCCEVCLSSDKKDKRFRSSILIKIRGKYFLIDCSPDLRLQLLETFVKSPFQCLDGVLLTHGHYDHVGGLDDLRFFGRKTRVVNIYLEQAVAEAIRNRLPYIFKEEKKYPGVPFLRLNEIKHDPFWISDIAIIPIRLMHGKLPIFGYRIGNFAYLTDLTVIPKEEMPKLKNLSVIVINALRKSLHATHQNLKEAIKNIEKIQPQKAYLTHMCHQFGLYKQVKKELPENIFIAYDGLEIEV